MCEDCDDDTEFLTDSMDGFPIAEVIEATRFVESELAGDSVGEDMWAVYFGQAGGCLDGRSFARIEQAKEAALVFLSTLHARPAAA